MLEAIKKYFSKEISILGSLKPRFVWILYWVISALSLGLISLFVAKLISYFSTQLANFLGHSVGGFVFIVFIIILFRIFLENKLRGYILITLFFSAIAFIVEKYFLNNEIFSPFTTRTTIILWITFLTLFASIFYQRFSKWIVLFFPPVLFVGFLVSFCLILILIPYMLIGWVAILFLGLGILPYTPLMACIAFLVMCYRTVLELRDNQYYLQYTLSKYLTYALLLFTSIYFIWFHTEWNRGQFIIRNHFLENKIINSKRSLIDDDLPAWASLGMKLPANHVSELYLQPESSNNSILFTLFRSDKLFDPFAFIVSNISKKVDILNEDREHLLKLLFGYTKISLNRLWYGNSWITTKIETRLVFYPKLRIAKTEMQITPSRESNQGLDEIEYTFKLPEGSICNKLSIQRGGKEEFAQLLHLTKSQMNDKIIDSSQNIFAYATWMEDNFLRVKLNPIKGEEIQTFKIGIVSPLKLVNSKLEYNSFKIEGPILNSANHNIFVSVYEPKDTNLSGKSYTFEKNISRSSKEDFSTWFAYGKYKDEWSVILDNAPFKKNELQSISESEIQEKEFHPDKIYILINSSLSKKEWKNVYSRLSSLGISSQIILVTNEWFYSKSIQENLDFIDSQVLPKFNLFPFYKIVNDSDILIITNREESSIPFHELKGSAFFTKNIEFFSKNKKNIYVNSLNGKLSTYFNSLNEYELIQDISAPLDEISSSLKELKIKTVKLSEDKILLKDARFTIQFEKEMKKKIDSEFNLISKLAIYKKIMRILGKRILPTKEENDNFLFELADRNKIVTPISSFFILRNSRDFDSLKYSPILTESESFKQDEKISIIAKLKNESLPDPKLWIIGIICFVIILIWGNTKLRRH